jgi:glycerol-3-phosphate O-acyltransferase/dihydroxyacetone phosphate acyltransferase
MRVLAGLASPLSFDIPNAELVAYSRPPLPAENPFLKRRTSGTLAPAMVGNVGDVHQSSKTTGSQEDQALLHPPPVSPTRLIRHLFIARLDAVVAVRRYLNTVGIQDGTRGELGFYNKIEPM